MLQHHIAIYAIMSMTKKILSPWPLSKRRGEIPVSSYVPLQRHQWTPPPLGGSRVGVQGILMHILLPRPSGTRCRQACFSSSLGIAKASFSSALAHSSNLQKMGNWGPRLHCDAVARNKARTRASTRPYCNVWRRRRRTEVPKLLNMRNLNK